MTSSNSELEQLTAYWEARHYRPGVNLDSLDADLAEARAH